MTKELKKKFEDGLRAMLLQDKSLKGCLVEVVYSDGLKQYVIKVQL